MKSTQFNRVLAVVLSGLMMMTLAGFTGTQRGILSPAPTVLVPTSPATTVYSASGVEVDASNLTDGYITARYTGDSNARLKLRITKSGGTLYNYDLSTGGNYEVFAFTEGSGDYTIQVYQNVSGSSYAQLLSQTVSVNLKSDTLPFLYPSQYVNFTADSKTVKKGNELAAGAATELEVVQKVYNYVVKNITYDNQFAQAVQAGQVTSYLPNVDEVLDKGKGVCFDYAAVMTAMLRSQNIPAKLVVGYAGKVYHAWINTYISDVGWVDGVIYFDGTNWKLMDPTFASSGGKGAGSFIGDGSNYSKVYVY